MWGGAHFLVSLHALVDVKVGEHGRVPPRDLNTPGLPRSMRVEVDGRRVVVASMANATLFLETLKATGNHIHLLSQWPKRDTERVVHAFGWSKYITDLRWMRLLPGFDVFTLSSVECSPSWYADVCLISEEQERWHPNLAPQQIHVRHNLELMAGDDASTTSMELLYTLCQCIRIAEWRLRYPGTSIACCIALSSATVFGYCRFYMPPSALDSETSLLISSHGGFMVATEQEASHVVLADEEESSTDTDSSSSSSTSSSVEGGSRSGSSSVVNSGDDEEASPPPQTKATPNDMKKESTTLVAPREVVPSSSSLTAANPSRTTTTKVEAVDATSSAVCVSKAWVRRCCRALRVLPAFTPPPPSSSSSSPTQADASSSTTDIAESLRTTGTLLMAMLPPEDARPLMLHAFLSSARRYGYAIEFMANQTSIEAVVQELQRYFNDVVKMKVVKVENDPSSSSSSPSSALTCFYFPSMAASPTLRAKSDLFSVQLCRREAARDRDAVSAHLRLLSTQFSYSIDFIRRQRYAATHAYAGTQTCGPRYASIGIMADVVDDVPLPKQPSSPTCTGEAIKRKEDELAPPPAKGDAAEAVELAAEAETEEWRHHLRNAEGKVLKSERCTSEELSMDATAAAPPSSFVAQQDGAQHHDASAPPPTMPYQPPPMMVESIFSLPPNLLRPMEMSSGVDAIFAAPPPPPYPGPDVHHADVRRANSNVDVAELRQVMGVAASTAKEDANLSDDGVLTCFLSTSAINAAGRLELLAFLRALPIFGRDAAATLRLERGGIRCIFAESARARDFARCEHITFDGRDFNIVLQRDPSEVGAAATVATPAPSAPPPPPPTTTTTEAPTATAPSSSSPAAAVKKPEEITMPQREEVRGRPPHRKRSRTRSTSPPSRHRLRDDGDERKHHDHHHHRDARPRRGSSREQLGRRSTGRKPHK